MAGGTVIGAINSGGLKYRVWTDGGSGVAGFIGAALTNVTIPPTVSDERTTYRVTHVYEEVFWKKSEIQTITFQAGSNLVEIQQHAFSELTNLRSIDLSNCKNLVAVQDEAFSGLERLTSRRKEILKDIVEGLSVKEIADKRGISVNTVKTHIKNIYTDLGAANHSDAIRIALSKGIV